MKTWLKKFLLKKNLYYPARYSHLFTIYQRLFKPAEIKKQQDEIAFYQSFLPSCKLIFDIGANDGHKTEAFLAIAEKVICCEPDTTNFHLLQVRFRNKKNRVMLENSAVADKEGISELYIHHPGSAFNTLSSKWKNILQEDNMQKWNEQVNLHKHKP
ncbi:MAG: FkbM family methyltransferase [Bacteroidota bacterium]